MKRFGLICGNMRIGQKYVITLLSISLSVYYLEGQERPNIVLILADDLGYGDLKSYNVNSKIPTPHLDALAEAGLRFTDAHSPSSVCTPTRYGILTGRYAWRTALQKSVLWPWDPPLLEEDRLTLGDMLNEQGYETACVGKWHLGWRWRDTSNNYVDTKLASGQYDAKKREQLSYQIDFSKPIDDGPLAHGFDYYFGDDVPNFPPYIFIENNKTLGIPSIPKPENMFGNPGIMIPGWDLTAVMPLITQKACQYITERSDKQQTPFFLYFSLTAPHTPIAPTGHFIGKSQAGWYGDYVHQVDWSVGQIINTLRQQGSLANTLIIFTSDNGSPHRDGNQMNGAVGSVSAFDHNPSGPLRGLKSDIWEGGHRVPFIIRWDGHILANQVSSEPMIHVDLMRSIATLTGYALPTNAAEDSYNLLPAWYDQERQHNIRPHLIHHSGQGIFAIRKENWKLILGQSSGGFSKYEAPSDAPPGQLYDLSQDPTEADNLYEKYPQKVNQLTTSLQKLKDQGFSFVQ